MAHSHPQVSIDDLVDQLRTRGVRVTTARRAVLGVLVGAGERHLSADELAAEVQRDDPSVHLSTIYRTLDSLEEAGLITLARFSDHPVTYHLAGDVHHHAVCTRCATVLQLPADALDGVSRTLMREHGFHAAPRHLTIPGICADCAAEPVRRAPLATAASTHPSEIDRG